MNNYNITQDEFMYMAQEVFTKASNLLLNKNQEYGNEDKFHNFNAAAALRNTTPETALAGMLIKHIISVYDMIDQLEVGIHNPVDKWDEKTIDVINYMVILRGLISIRNSSADVTGSAEPSPKARASEILKKQFIIDNMGGR